MYDTCTLATIDFKSLKYKGKGLFTAYTSLKYGLRCQIKSKGVMAREEEEMLRLCWVYETDVNSQDSNIKAIRTTQ